MSCLFVSVSELWFSPCQGFQIRAVLLLVLEWDGAARICGGVLGNCGVCSWSEVQLEKRLLCDISTIYLLFE